MIKIKKPIHNLVNWFFILIFVKTIKVMERFRITTGKNGKCDVLVTILNHTDSIISTHSSTYDVKPTVKEIIEKFKPYKNNGGEFIRIVTMPSRKIKTYKL